MNLNSHFHKTFIGDVFGPLEFSRRDLMAINIQRGRDHGLPDYNTARQAMGLSKMPSFYDINPSLFDDTPGVSSLFHPAISTFYSNRLFLCSVYHAVAISQTNAAGRDTSSGHCSGTFSLQISIPVVAIAQTNLPANTNTSSSLCSDRSSLQGRIPVVVIAQTTPCKEGYH